MMAAYSQADCQNRIFQRVDFYALYPLTGAERGGRALKNIGSCSATQRRIAVPFYARQSTGVSPAGTVIAVRALVLRFLINNVRLGFWEREYGRMDSCV